MAHTKYISTHNDVILASPLLISKMFREMVKEYEEELKAIEDDQNGTGLSGDEIVLLYDILLAELSVNSKVSITDLTIIAGQQIMLGAGIADAICHRIVEESVEQKLASLYLLDSIVKNIGRDYIKYFSARLPEVFCEAYKQVHPNMQRTMRLLLGSWSTVFPLSVLKKIESGLQITSSANHQSLRASSSNLSRKQLRPPAAVRFNNGLDVDRIRALIDAYGTDKRTEKIDMSWKNSDEEEFDWEKMSPTLADEGKNDVISSSLQSHLRQDWPNQKQFPAVNGPMLQTYQPERPIRGQLDNLNGNNLLVNQVAPASFMGPPPLLAHQFQRGYAPGRMASVGTMVPSPNTQSPLPTRLHGSPLPLPHGFSGASHTRPISQPSSGAPNRPPLGNLCSSFNPDSLKDITDEGSQRKRMRI